ncbi:MAG: hypothetical protein Q4E54_06255 [Lachnospiraceae bacterium]|nr:hypothetical protein [Lachnospiraceae bacterium]
MADNRNNQRHTVDINRLEMLVTIVRRKKADYYKDLIASYDVNLQTTILARGTASTEMKEYLGLDNTEKIAIVSIIKKEYADKALADIEEKFKTIKNGKGIAFTVPMSSVIGVSLFAFLSNNRDMIKEQNYELK